MTVKPNPLTQVFILFSHRNNIVLVVLSSSVRRRRVKIRNGIRKGFEKKCFIDNFFNSQFKLSACTIIGSNINNDILFIRINYLQILYYEWSNKRHVTELPSAPTRFERLIDSTRYHV